MDIENYLAAREQEFSRIHKRIKNFNVFDFNYIPKVCDLIFWRVVLQDIEPFGREFYDRYGEYLWAKSVEPFIQGKVPSLLSFRTERIGDAESRILSECSLEDRFRIFSACRRKIAE